jgi:proteasome lid subunit RPN8/RPN11
MRIATIWMSPDALRTVLDGLAAPERAEPCGALLGYRVPLGIEVVEAVRLKNAHPSPDRGFLLEPAAILDTGRSARAKELDLVGFWHGHREGPAWPGMLDEEGMRGAQIDGTQPYVHVVAGRGTTGKRVIRGFRQGRTHPKQVPIEALKKPRGHMNVASTPAGSPS